MEADGRFIKNENRIFLGAPHFACQLEPLRFPTGKSRRFFSQCQVPEAQFPQNLESSFDEFHVLAESERMIHIHVHQFRKGSCFSLFIHKTDAFCVLPIARAMAGRAGNLHIRQELYIQADDACPVTDWTSEFSRIVREISCFESLFPGTFAPGVDFSQLIMDIRISRNRRSYIDANRRRIDKFDILYAGRIDRKHMAEEFFACKRCQKSRDKTFKHHGRLSRAGYTCHDREPSLRDFCVKRLYCMDRPRFHPDASFAEDFFLGNNRKYAARIISGKETAYFRLWIFADFFDSPLCNDISSITSRIRPHFNNPGCFFQDLRVMIDKDDGVPVADEIFHDAAKPLDIRRMKSYRRFIQDIKDAGRPVPDRSCQLHSLPFAGRERASCPVQRKIGQAKIHQPFCCPQK